nr:predicted protein [Ipomoea batatas]
MLATDDGETCPVRRLCDRSNIISRLRFVMLSGIVPLSMFPLRSSSESNSSFETESGIGPMNLLCCRRRLVSCLRSKSFSGIGPSNSLLNNERPCRFASFDSSGGMVPEKLFSCSTKSISIEQLKRSSGISPDILFPPKDSNPMSDGIGPVKELNPMDRYVKVVKFVMDEGIWPVNLLMWRVRTCSDSKDPISEGIVPVNSFWDSPKWLRGNTTCKFIAKYIQDGKIPTEPKLRWDFPRKEVEMQLKNLQTGQVSYCWCSRLTRLPKSAGIVPVRLLKMRLTCNKEVQLNKVWGILPLRKLFPKSRVSRLPRPPSSDGIGPERKFPKSVSSRRCEQSPNWGGILPVKKFKVRSRTWRLERFPMEGEISPFNCMSMREMLTTRVDKGSHVTPVQLQWPFASSVQSTRLPKGSSRIEALKAFMASTSTSKLPGSPG